MHYIVINKFSNMKHQTLDGKRYLLNNHFIIGGDAIYKLAMEDLDICDIFATEVYQNGEEYDTYFPKINYSGDNTDWETIESLRYLVKIHVDPNFKA